MMTHVIETSARVRITDSSRTKAFQVGRRHADDEPMTSSVKRTTITPRAAARAFATGPAAQAVDTIATTLREGLAGSAVGAVLYFAAADYDPKALAGPLAARFPEAAVIGCSTAGEFTDTQHQIDGITAVALPEGVVGRAVAVLGDLSQSAAQGTDAAVAALEKHWGSTLRELAVDRHLGFVLIDGLHGDEEAVNERLGNAAPLLDVVGGSAADNLTFERTWVTAGDQVSEHGIALLVIESRVPFRVVKACSFECTGTTLRITKADAASRRVLEFDGQPAINAYAAAIGLGVDQADSSAFLAHPLGLMIDGEPWIRSPRQVEPDGSLAFYCQIVEGMDVEVMQSTGLVADTAAAIRAAREELGGASGAVYFNCVLRRLEMDAEKLHEDFLKALGGIPSAGFHTYGESWMGHINQTLTGVVFG
jgi:hypothetical protein